MQRNILALLTLCALTLAGCAGNAASASGGAAQALADNTTKAAYNNDLEGVTANMDDTLKTTITRSQVGSISDAMHSQLGTYQGVELMSSDPTKNEYTYRATFTNGTAPVVVRIDSSGKLAAYHIYIPKK